MRPELAQIVPELVEPILLGGKLEPGQDGLVEFCGPLTGEATLRPCKRTSRRRIMRVS